jgi:hypothetical protein
MVFVKELHTMKRNSWLRLGTVVCASVVMSVAVPGLAAAQQASGANSGIGVVAPAQTAPVQLPRTGNPDAETTSAMDGLPALLLASGVTAAFLVIRRRVRRAAGQREPQ